MHMQLIYADCEFVNVSIDIGVGIGISHASSTRKYCTKISYKIL